MKPSYENDGISIMAPISPEFQRILIPDALSFVAGLARKFESRRKELLARRQQVQADIDKGILPDFPSETEEIRKGAWKADPVPEDLQDRRVEITGPVERKMIINALNSGAQTFMADFEDSHSPTWEGTIQGQINLRDAVDGTIEITGKEGKAYRLNEKIATLIVRPRGWHLIEKHVLVDGEPISASIFDFGLYLYHNAKTLINKGSGPYFYLPKLESYLEARLWNDIFIASQNELVIPRGTIKATVLIETILAAFQMEEIIYELKEHMAGLNCGRWDYIFSYIKRFTKVPGYLFPDRSEITMTSPCMRSYSLLAIKTCHKRETHAIGGMAAQVPIKGQPEANERAFQKVRDDKTREAGDGHDGTWVAHPGLVPVALDIFNKLMPKANQIGKKRNDIQVTREDLLLAPQGRITETGLRTNINVGIQYMASWLSGNGCVAINHLMEDAATAEISRAQVWQWLHLPGGVLADGRKVDNTLFEEMVKDEVNRIRSQIGDQAFEKGNYAEATSLFKEIILQDEFEEFLTLKAYDHLI